MHHCIGKWLLILFKVTFFCVAAYNDAAHAYYGRDIWPNKGLDGTVISLGREINEVLLAAFVGVGWEGIL